MSSCLRHHKLRQAVQDFVNLREFVARELAKIYYVLDRGLVGTSKG